jgi:hypothetical protein
MPLMTASPLHCSADHLDLDRGVEGQPGHADSGAGVPSVLAQHLDEQFTGRVDGCDCSPKSGVLATKTSICTIRTRSRSPPASTAAESTLSAA